MIILAEHLQKTGAATGRSVLCAADADGQPTLAGLRAACAGVDVFASPSGLCLVGYTTRGALAIWRVAEGAR